MDAPGHHEDGVGGGGERAIVVEIGRAAGVFVDDAVDVDGELAACGVQARGERGDERAERGAVGGAVVLEVEVQAGVAGAGAVPALRAPRRARAAVRACGRAARGR